MYSEQVYLNWIFRIVLATLCGCAIGYERTSRNKSAGIRTHAIIALGSSMFMIISKYAFFDVSTADGARVAAQIVSGIGFLGAGVIFVKDDLIQGLTTAAGMWDYFWHSCMYWCWIDFYWCFCDIISSRSSKDISLSFFQSN